jgi:peptidoglycan/LPS O-acetylase OafA/YrhL
MREPILDLCRFLAAILVLGRHWLSQQWPIAERLSNYSSNNTYINKILKHLADLCHVGFLGVHVFFIISGYIVIKSAMTKTPNSFFISRFVRLAPLFIISYIGSAVVGGYIFEFEEYHSIKNILLSISMANYPLSMKGPNGQSWTLWWEIRFYFLIFLVLLFTAKHQYTQVRLKRIFLVSTLIWLAMICIPGSKDGFVGSFLIHDFAPFFIFGCLLAYVRVLKDGIILGPFLILTFSLMIHKVLEEVHSQLNTTNFDVVAVAVVIVFVALLICNIKYKMIGAGGKLVYVMNILGKITYPIYLLHMVIIAALIQFIINSGSSILIAIVMSFFIMIITSLLYVLFVEPPINKYLIDRINKSLNSVLKD